MDRRERMSDQRLAMRALLGAFEGEIWTASPAIVVDEGFDANLLTVSAQPAIQAQVRAPTGQSWINAALPKCVDCPVIFAGGGGYVATMPIALGDEGLLVFADRCIDAWWQNGGPTQPQAELRMHDLSDGFFIPGVFSNPRAKQITGGASATEAQLRTLDAAVMARINATTKQAGLVAGASSLVVDGTANKCSVTAAAGLWVNGVMVTVP